MEAESMIRQLPSSRRTPCAAVSPSGCEHRTVSRDGRVVCGKITQGDNSISPELCRACPAMSVNCAHLRFSLNHSQSVPLVVRFSGHTEIWADDSPELLFHHAACAARVVPVQQPKSCAGCPLRAPLLATPDAAVSERQPGHSGKIVVLPAREHALAAG
jgi:hypothetical protein